MFDTSFPRNEGNCSWRVRMRSAQAGSERVLVTSERCWPRNALPRLKKASTASLALSLPRPQSSRISLADLSLQSSLTRFLFGVSFAVVIFDEMRTEAGKEACKQRPWDERSKRALVTRKGRMGT
eukprot:g29274.t1